MSAVKNHCLSHWTVAAVQMNSGSNLRQNLEDAKAIITQAAAAGAEFVLLPEYFYLMGECDSDRLALAETAGRGPVQDFLSTIAAELGIWLQGTAPLRGPDPLHIYNSSLLYDSRGACISRYDKIHLFNFYHGDESCFESHTLAAGNQVVDSATPFGVLRSVICYDLRFPEIFRRAQMDIITLPAAFTKVTGAAHWTVLLRARAIENQCWLIGAAQVGRHPNGKNSYGHSMIVDPWGDVLDEVLSEQPGFALAILHKSSQQHIREKLPVLQHSVLK